MHKSLLLFFICIAVVTGPLNSNAENAFEGLCQKALSQFNEIQQEHLLAKTDIYRQKRTNQVWLSEFVNNLYLFVGPQNFSTTRSNLFTRLQGVDGTDVNFCRQIRLSLRTDFQINGLDFLQSFSVSRASNNSSELILDNDLSNSLPVDKSALFIKIINASLLALDPYSSIKQNSNPSQRRRFTVKHQSPTKPNNRIQHQSTEKLAMAIKAEDGSSLGYIKITTFAPTEAEKYPFLKFQNSLKYILQKNVSGLVIDLRGNKGGLLEELTNILSMLLKPSSLFSLILSDEKVIDYFTNNNLPLLFNAPIVLLVDATTASAPEWMASIMRQRRRALIVGAQNTFGKGVAQGVFSFVQKNEFANFIATGTVTDSYFVNSEGNSLQAKGVRPDILTDEKLNHNKSWWKDSPSLLSDPNSFIPSENELSQISSINESDYWLSEEDFANAVNSVTNDPTLRRSKNDWPTLNHDYELQVAMSSLRSLVNFVKTIKTSAQTHCKTYF